MIRFANPYFVSPVQAKANQHAPAVIAWLQAPTQAANKVITLAELRAGLPAIAADLTRQVVNQITAMIGATIENPEDPSP